MFVLEAETKLFINRLSALSCNNVTSMLKILYRHVKETVQQSPNISQDFIDFVVTVKHVCKIMIKMEIAVHAFKETHLESCSYYNIHGEINVLLLKCCSVQCEYIFFPFCCSWHRLLRVLT
jgi:predicted choloylglycine hydrolase